jgi:hypothetical protein
MVRIELDLGPGIKGLCRRLVPETGDRINQGFINAINAAQSRARELAPRGKGYLREGISGFVRAHLEGGLISRSPYSSFLHFGTGLYGPGKKLITIESRGEKALWWKGAPHPVKRVVQKGIKPMDFIRSAISESLLTAAFHKGFDKDRP